MRLNKTKLATEHFINGNYKDAFKIVKTFKINNSSDLDLIIRGYESIVHPSFYLQLGQDINKNISDAKIACKKILGIE